MEIFHQIIRIIRADLGLQCFLTIKTIQEIILTVLLSKCQETFGGMTLNL
jgi:hypothetical protein